MPKVRTDFTEHDIVSLFIEGMGWQDVTPGSLTDLPSHGAIAFIDRDGDQVNVTIERVIATAVYPAKDADGDEPEEVPMSDGEISAAYGGGII